MICNPHSNVVSTPLYSDIFAENTWEQIITAYRAKKVPDTWAADGTCYKDMEIGGRNYRIDIIGKNHDDYADGSGKAPLTFQMHDCYDDLMEMNAVNTNSGGWAYCAMRGEHLPVILDLMPAEVRAAIREVWKETSAGSSQSSIQTTDDKLFLLSEIEIFGSTTVSFEGEGAQYDYYKAGNSPVKKCSGSDNSWWGRSPYPDNAAFALADSTGSADAGVASDGNGVAFGFCF